MGCCGQRDLFVTGPGPDAGGPNQGKAGCVPPQVNAGIDAAPFVAPLAGPPPDATVWPRAAVTTAAANAMFRRKFHCLRMPTSISMVSPWGDRKSARMDWAERCLPAES